MLSELLRGEVEDLADTLEPMGRWNNKRLGQLNRAALRIRNSSTDQSEKDALLAFENWTVKEDAQQN